MFFVPQVKKAFQGRVTLPGYSANRYNASLALSGLRSSDSGLYRCEIVVGINDEQDTVPLEVTGEWSTCFYRYADQLLLCDQSALMVRLNRHTGLRWSISMIENTSDSPTSLSQHSSVHSLYVTWFKFSSNWAEFPLLMFWNNHCGGPQSSDWPIFEEF